MTEKEVSELFICLAFQYESALDALLAKGVIDQGLIDAMKDKFYGSLNEEKIRTSQKNQELSGNYTPIHEANDLQRYGIIDGIDKAIF